MPMTDTDSGALPERSAGIVVGACRAFLAHGYEGTSMELVAAEAGVTKKTVYNHFCSKEALFAAVTASFCDEIAGAIDRAGMPSGEAAVGLVHFCRKFVETLAQPPGREIYRLAVGLGLRFPEFGRSVSQMGVSRMEAALVDYLVCRSAAGDLHVEDAEVAAECLLGAMLVMVHRALFGVAIVPGSVESEAFIQTAVAAFCRAYAPRGQGDQP